MSPRTLTKQETTMKFLKTTGSLVAAMIMLMACAGTPEMNPELAELEARLDRAQSSQTVQQYAAVEVDDAAAHVAKAHEAWENRGNDPYFQHRLHLANRSLDIAETKTEVARLEAQAETMRAERQRLRLEARAARSEAARELAEARAAAAEAEAGTARAAALQAEVQRQEAALAAAAARAERAAAAEEAREARMRSEMAMEEAREARAGESAAEARAAAAEARNEELMAKLADLEARPTERGTVLTLAGVLFDVDKATLKPGGERMVKKIADFLVANEERQIRVEGFTDSTGPDSYNQDLSERRANAVRAELMEQGVDASRINAVGYGEQYPVATNDTTAGRQQNRRVEVIISDDDQPVAEREA